MSAVPQSIAVTGKWLHCEFVAARPVFVFFLVAFVLQLLIIKLAVAEFSIPITAFSQAVVGALLAAKAVLILDETRLGRSLERYRKIVAVGVKTILYRFGALLLGYLERFLEALHRSGSFDEAVRDMIDQANLYRFSAWVLGVTLRHGARGPKGRPRQRRRDYTLLDERFGFEGEAILFPHSREQPNSLSRPHENAGGRQKHRHHFHEGQRGHQISEPLKGTNSRVDATAQSATVNPARTNLNPERSARAAGVKWQTGFHKCELQAYHLPEDCSEFEIARGLK
ncbi:MAG: hypothetical protein WCD12_15835 [Candidatus Binatus sp.]|jgi:hypothetical protein|uniref:hypothetical protein n=1 Tax=Candidatus Binatus sp. TaxID=2811406 RepID=UPI003C726FF5